MVQPSQTPMRPASHFLLVLLTICLKVFSSCFNYSILPRQRDTKLTCRTCGRT